MVNDEVITKQMSKVKVTGDENEKKMFFAHIFVKSESIYIKPTSKLSLAHSLHIVKYTVSQKNWATFLRPITLEILNRSLPNLAKIKVFSF